MPDSTTRDSDTQAKAVELMAPHWPGAESHCRQEAFRGLVGGLLRGGMDVQAVEELVGRLCEKTADEEAENAWPSSPTPPPG
jgi:hypothetical protein